MTVKLYSCGIDRTGEDVLTPDAHASYLSKFSADEFEIPHLSTSDSFTITLPRYSGTPPVERFYNYMEANGEFFFLSRVTSTPVVGDVVTYDARKDKPHSYRVADPAKVFTPRSVIRRTTRPVLRSPDDRTLTAGRKQIKNIESLHPDGDGTFDIIFFFDEALELTDDFVATDKYGGVVKAGYIVDGYVRKYKQAPFSYADAVYLMTDITRNADKIYLPPRENSRAFVPTNIFLIESAYVPSSWRATDPEALLSSDAYLTKDVQGVEEQVVCEAFMHVKNHTATDSFMIDDEGNDIDVGNVAGRVRIKNNAIGHPVTYTLETRRLDETSPLSFLVHIDGTTYDYTSMLSLSFSRKYVTKQDVTAAVESRLLSALSVAAAGARTVISASSGNVVGALTGAASVASSVGGLLTDEGASQERTVTNAGYSLLPARERYVVNEGDGFSTYVEYASLFVYRYDPPDEVRYDNLKRGYHVHINPTERSLAASLGPYLWKSSADHDFANHTYMAGEITFIDDDHPDDTLEIYRRGIDIYTDADVYGQVIARD